MAGVVLENDHIAGEERPCVRPRSSSVLRWPASGVEDSRRQRAARFDKKRRATRAKLWRVEMRTRAEHCAKAGQTQPGGTTYDQPAPLLVEERRGSGYARLV